MNAELQKCIVNKATLLFYKFGIKSITMDYIASELGISKRTLYENFKNKDALIIACMEQSRESYHKQFQAISESNINTIEKLVRYYEVIVDYYNNTSRSFQLDVERMHSKVNEEYENSRNKAILYTRNLLRSGVEEGLIRNDIDIDLISLLYSDQMDWFRRSKDIYKLEYKISEILKNIVFIFIRGVATEQGNHILDKILENKNNIHDKH